jgi:hypothetical protein
MDRASCRSASPSEPLSAAAITFQACQAASHAGCAPVPDDRFCDAFINLLSSPAVTLVPVALTRIDPDREVAGASADRIALRYPSDCVADGIVDCLRCWRTELIAPPQAARTLALDASSDDVLDLPPKIRSWVPVQISGEAALNANEGFLNGFLGSDASRPNDTEFLARISPSTPPSGP